MSESVCAIGFWRIEELVIDEDSEIVADVCFDSKRILGCYVCPIYDCEMREL